MGRCSNRGQRLWQDKRRKRKVRERIEERVMGMLNITPRMVGKHASVHDAICSCTACGNPRRHFSEVTLQELTSDESFEDQMMKEEENEIPNDDSSSDATD